MLKDLIEKRIRELDKQNQQKKGKEKFFFPFSEEFEMKVEKSGDKYDKTNKYNSKEA